MTLTLKLEVEVFPVQGRNPYRLEHEVAAELRAGAERIASGLNREMFGCDFEVTNSVTMVINPCPCGSGLESEWQCDARGIELCRTCPQCHQAVMSRYRPDVLTHPNYEADEPCEQRDRL